MAGDEEMTPEQRRDAQEHDVQRYAYRDSDGQYYTINDRGRRARAADTQPRLDAEHQQLAEQTAAIVMLYPTIRALNAEDRNIIDQLTGATGEAAEALAARLSGPGRDVWGQLSGLPGFRDIQEAREGAGRVGGAIMFVPNLVRDLLGAGGEVVDAVGGRTINRENAIAIGTAFASAAQARREGREPDFMRGLFSRNFFEYAGAAFGVAGDWISGFVIPLVERFSPGAAEWLRDNFDKNGNRDFNAHLNNAFGGKDNRSVAEEMREFRQIGGVDTTDMAAFLTRGGTGRTNAGAEGDIERRPDGVGVQVNCEANPDSAACQPGAELTPDAVAEAASEGNVFQRLGVVWGDMPQIFGNTGASVAAMSTLGVGGVVLAGASTAAIYQAGRGVIEGAQRQFAGARSGPERRAVSASARATDLMEQAERTRSGQGFNLRFWENADAREARALRLEQRANDLIAETQRNARIVEARGGAAAAAGAHAPHSNWNIFRNSGRMAGAAGGTMVERFMNTVSRAGAGMGANAMAQIDDIRGAPARFAAIGSQIGDRVSEISERLQGRGETQVSGQRAAAETAEVADDAARATRRPARGTRAAAQTAEVADDAARAARPAMAATQQAAIEAAEAAARMPRPALWRRGLASVARVIPGKGRAISAAILGTAVVATTAGAASAADEARARFGEGDEERGNEAAMEGMTTVASLFSLAAGSVGFYLSEGYRLNNEGNRGDRVPANEAQALIEMMSVAERGSSDPALRKIRTLVLERDQRAAAGRSLDVTITVTHDGRRIMDIIDSQGGDAVMMMGEGMPFTYNANLNDKLLEEARLYLGSHGTLESVARELGIPDAVRDRILSRHRAGVEADAGMAAAVAETGNRQRPGAPQSQAAAAAAPLARARVERSETAGVAANRGGLFGTGLELPQLPQIQMPTMPRINLPFFN